MTQEGTAEERTGPGLAQDWLWCGSLTGTFLHSCLEATGKLPEPCVGEDGGLATSLTFPRLGLSLGGFSNRPPDCMGFHKHPRRRYLLSRGSFKKPTRESSRLPTFQVMGSATYDLLTDRIQLSDFGCGASVSEALTW